MRLWPEWRCRSELWQPNSGKIYCKVVCADRENVFLTYPWACLKKAFCKMFVTTCGRFCPDEGAVAGCGNWIQEKYTAKWRRADCRNDFQAQSKAFFASFYCFFNYVLFYFIFIQSFCFNQNCLKLHFNMIIYFLEIFCGFICSFHYLKYDK